MNPTSVDALVNMPLLMLALGLALTGSVSDMRTRRIPNWLTVGAFGTAMVVRVLGPEPVGSGLAGAGIAFLIGLALFAVKSIGAGDVKYLTAFGAILGAGRIWPALLLVTLTAGALAVVSAVATGRAPALFRSSARLGLYGLTLGKLGSRRILSDAATDVALAPIPLGVAIAVGCCLALFV